jgi:hypothetical protein
LPSVFVPKPVNLEQVARGSPHSTRPLQVVIYTFIKTAMSIMKAEIILIVVIKYLKKNAHHFKFIPIAGQNVLWCITIYHCKQQKAMR